MGQQRHNSLNLHATKGRREGGGNRTALGKIEQGKYITESDLQHDFNKTQDVERKHRLESANYQIFSGDAADIWTKSKKKATVDKLIIDEWS